MKKTRFITFGVFIIGAIGLILTSLFVPNDFWVVTILCLVLSFVVFVPGLLDPHLNQHLRVSVLVIGLLFFIASMVGILLTETNLPVEVFCLIFAILEIINGVAEFLEGFEMITEKNYVMGALFIVDALIEIVLGILMSIERHATLRTHVILISSDLVFEGIIKLINEYVEERKGIKSE